MSLLEFLIGAGTVPSASDISGAFLNSGLFGSPGSINDISAGDIVAVTVSTGNLASRVNIVRYIGVSIVYGAITAVSSESITITPPDNTAVTLNWDGNTRFLLRGIISVQVGQVATAFYRLNYQNTIIVAVRAPAATATPTATVSPVPTATLSQ